MPEQLEVHVEPLLLETGSFIQELTVRFDGLERSMIIYTTRNANEARLLAAELEGLLRRLIAAARPDAIA